MKLLATINILITLLVTVANCWESGVDTIVIRKIKTGNVLIKTNRNRANIVITKNDNTTFEHRFSTTIPKTFNEDSLLLDIYCGLHTTCIRSKNETYIKIRHDPDSEVIRISRSISNPDAQLTDCYLLAENTQWFGGPERGYQTWPVQHMHFVEASMTSGNVQLPERYWLSSQGFYVFVDAGDALFLDQNNIKDRHLCLVAKNKAPYRRRNIITLNYEIGVFPDPRLAHEHVIEGHFGKPTGHPNAFMVTHPVWSTWARYKDDVNDTVVRKFADEIIENGFNHSQLEIDDNWESCYGSFTFNTIKFPDIAELLADLKTKNFRVTLWIHPFINEGCNDGDEAYDYALENDFFVKNTDGSVRTTWWDGGNGAGAIDFTNPKAVEWWVGRVKKLEAMGFDSFKFDAGETTLIPQIANLTGPEELQPEIYCHNYTSNLAKYFNDSIEVRVGWRAQQLPIFVRMTDKDSHWTYNNGLPTLITTLLQMNLNGYVFVLPDMIGVNGYGNGVKQIELPSKEIFIRWLQASAFMPSLQYSFTPWDFDNETIGIAKTFTDIHADIAPKILELMEKAVQTGAPINPPIWWVDPTNEEAHKINDVPSWGGYFGGSNHRGKCDRTRRVSGCWKDRNNGVIYEGPIWLRTYSAPLGTLPHFYRV